MAHSPLRFVLLASMTLLASIGSEAKAQEKTFFCGRKDGNPTTLARTPRGNTAVITWVTTLGGVTPQERCTIVSERFQTYYEQGLLNFITTGKMNGQLVLCVAQRRGGACKESLFTLKPGSDPAETITRLFNASRFASGPISESNCRLYVDMTQFLGPNAQEVKAECPKEDETDTP